MTPLCLLLKYLIDTDRQDLVEDCGKHLFKLSYQTHCFDTNFINEPSVFSDTSPNAYYITEGYKNISEWFKSIPETKHILQVKQIINMFMGLITNTKETLNINKYGYVAEDIRHSEHGKKIYALRSQTIERTFADAKEKHAMRYTFIKSLPRVQNWIRLKFATMNLKKLAMWA